MSRHRRPHKFHRYHNHHRRRRRSSGGGSSSSSSSSSGSNRPLGLLVVKLTPGRLQCIYMTYKNSFRT